MIITCPHCRTQYQVTFDAIGAAGRKVQCAQCRQAWQQQALPTEPDLSDTPQPPRDPDQFDVFEGLVEDALDEAMIAEERDAAEQQSTPAGAKTAAAPDEAARTAVAKVDPAAIRSRQRDFSRRRRTMEAGLPLAKLRRTVRVGALLLLCGAAAGFFLGREMIVDRFPDFAGVYEAIGLGVNVVGLEFSGVTTLHSLRDGKDLLTVSAQIVGITSEPRLVPPVVVSLLDEHGGSIYEWSVTPAVRDLMAGERASFDTQLLTPPSAAARVRLSFAGGSGAARQATVAAAQQAAEHPAPAAEHGAETPAATEHDPTSPSPTEHH